MFKPGYMQNFLWKKKEFCLVVSNIFGIVHFIYGIILPIDELIFFKMVIAPPELVNLKISPSDSPNL